MHGRSTSRIGWCIAVALITIMATPTHSRAEPPERLSLGEVLDLALRDNPQLQVVRRDLDMARGELTQARLYPFNPILEVGGNEGRSRSKAPPQEQRNVRGVAIGFSQVIELRGQRALRTDIAAANLTQMEWVIRDTERRILADVMRLFGELLVAQARLELADEAMALAEETREAVRKQAEAGETPNLDLLRAEVELRRAEIRQVAEGRQAAATRKDLNLHLGRATEAPLHAAGALLLPDPPGKPGAFFQRALELRPDLGAAETALQALRHGVSLIRAERYLPEMEVTLRYEKDHGFEERERRTLLDVAIPIPLFNRRRGDLEAMLAEAHRQRARISQVRAQIEAEVATALDQFERSQEIVSQYVQRILPQQEKNFRLLREGYTLGQFGLTEVLLSQRELIDSRFDYLESIGELNVAITNLRRATAMTRPSATAPDSGPMTTGYLVEPASSGSGGP